MLVLLLSLTLCLRPIPLKASLPGFWWWAIIMERPVTPVPTWLLAHVIACSPVSTSVLEIRYNSSPRLSSLWVLSVPVEWWLCGWNGSRAHKPSLCLFRALFSTPTPMKVGRGYDPAAPTTHSSSLHAKEETQGKVRGRGQEQEPEWQEGEREWKFICWELFLIGRVLRKTVLDLFCSPWKEKHTDFLWFWAVYCFWSPSCIALLGNMREQNI